MNLSQYYHTLQYLKPRQIVFRVYYSLRRSFRKAIGFRYRLQKTPESVRFFDFLPSLPAQVTWVPASHTFSFLHVSHTFGDRVDWSEKRFGKLWTYNLHYFEYLGTPGVSAAAGTALIEDFIRHLPAVPEALEPYPTALRILFWSRFLATHRIESAEIEASLYAQAYILADQIEYHLLGNHYLENGFGLLFAAYRYEDQYLYRKAYDIIYEELQEQILPDGGHFERSPMYHQIILYRVLDCLNLVSNNPDFGKPDFKPFLEKKAAVMMGWLQEITFSNGDIPLLNDSARGIAPDTLALQDYAKRLGVAIHHTPLQESGYRKFTIPPFELVADAGEIGPDYIPGHAHSDTLSFELYIDGVPFIVDTGVSTYEKNSRRQYERSTAAHNTVQVDQFEQTEVWDGFRVARRARPLILEEKPDLLAATHTGYDHLGIRHLRTFTVDSKAVSINDKVVPVDDKPIESFVYQAYIHFMEGVQVTLKEDNTLETALTSVRFEGATKVEIQPYEYAPAFNTLKPAQKAVIHFKDSLHTTIRVL